MKNLIDDKYVKGQQWSRDLSVVFMTIWLCQNHIESIVDKICEKLEQKFVSVTVYVGKWDTYVVIGTNGLMINQIAKLQIELRM